jgi:hypothetical protein
MERGVVATNINASAVAVTSENFMVIGIWPCHRLLENRRWEDPEWVRKHNFQGYRPEDIVIIIRALNEKQKQSDLIYKVG